MMATQTEFRWWGCEDAGNTVRVLVALATMLVAQ